MERIFSNPNGGFSLDQGRQNPYMYLYKLIGDLAKNAAKPERQAGIEMEIVTVVDFIANNRQGSDSVKIPDVQMKGETILHTAIKLLQFKNDIERRVFSLLLERFPKLLSFFRENTEYTGQTPLHMAVTKGNTRLVSTILDHLSGPESPVSKASLLRRRAIGAIFTNTAMMAEIPLSIAALTLNKDMVNLLLDHGAELDGVNSRGDTVCHSLIRYSFLYPERREEVLDMCQYLSEDPDPSDNSSEGRKRRKLRSKIWLMENGEGMNPLQLAAMKGQHSIFTFIMNLPTYCHENANDGLFDVRIYDVTEIDAISTMSASELGGNPDARVNKNILAENVPKQKAEDTQKTGFHTSVLQMMLEVDPVNSVQFILFPPLRRIIDQKWSKYCILFYFWWFLHTGFMGVLTWYGIERSKQNVTLSAYNSINSPPQFVNLLFQNTFVTVYAFIGVGMAALLVAQELIRIFRGKMPWTWNSFKNPYSNSVFRIMFLLFALSLVVDFLCALFVPYYELYSLYVAIILGWFLMHFFLRALRPFSFFTVLIQNVLVGDMFRFFVVLAFELVAFTTCVYMCMQAAAVDDNTYHNFGEIMLTLFKLMFGLGDFEGMLAARKPFVTVTVFVLFILFTTVLMVNALIAMMSNTCAEIEASVGNISARDMHWRLQRLSVVLFLESILSDCLVHHAGEPNEIRRYSNFSKHRRNMVRYQLEVRSLQQEVHEPEEEMPTWDWGFRAAVNKVIGIQMLGKTFDLWEPGERRERPSSAVLDRFKVKRNHGRSSGMQGDD